MQKRAIMIAGTGSDVGKSLIVAGLCRVFLRRGIKVRPFKPQNMSNNAAVTSGGGEIGRAQALQARAAGVAPSVHMNPVLLKPQSDIGSQVVVRGKMFGNYKAAEYQKLKPRLMGEALESFDILMNEADLVVVEGAGSPAEVNLRQGDFANMGFARALNIPVIIIGDIDRGGVIAALAGTKLVLAPEDAELIVGFLVNKFRGDPTLFTEGMERIEQLTGWAGLGLVPHFARARQLPAEDSVVLDKEQEEGSTSKTSETAKKVCVLQLPLISNFDDFDPLAAEPGLNLVFVKPGTPIPADTALVILPGSKAVISDLETLKSTGWDIDIKAHHRRGGLVLGICGGYQMLGHSICDPEGIEGPPAQVTGLGLLDVKTALTSCKSLQEVSGVFCEDHGTEFAGYEMHVGRTSGPGLSRPYLMMADGRRDGSVSLDGRVSGCYVHGLFARDQARRWWLQRLGAQTSDLNFEVRIESILNSLADHLERHVDCDRLLDLARAPERRLMSDI